MTASGPGDFDFLLGKWRVRHRTLAGRLTGATAWREADAIDIVRPAFAGLGNVGRFMRLVDGRPYEGMPVRLYDPRAEQWRIYWIDSADQRMEPPVMGRFQNGEGLFEGEDILRGTAIRVRFRWSDIRADGARWEQFYSGDAGQSWELNSTMEFQRDDTLPDDPDFSIFNSGGVR